MIATSRDGVALWWEASGDGEPVLLVPGRGDSTDVYPDRFSTALVEAGCQVIRYDARDTGLSGDGGTTYTLSDMADDAEVVLDAAGVGAAHLVGISMGGVILVDLASRRPERVASLVFLSALSPDPDAGIGDDFFAAFGADPLEARLQAMGETTDADRAWLECRARPRPTRASDGPPGGDGEAPGGGLPPRLAGTRAARGHQCHGARVPRRCRPRAPHGSRRCVDQRHRRQ